MVSAPPLIAWKYGPPPHPSPVQIGRTSLLRLVQIGRTSLLRFVQIGRTSHSKKRARAARPALSATCGCVRRYDVKPAAGSEEEKLVEVLQAPREWA